KTEKNLLSIFDLSEHLGRERAKLDVHQLAVAEVRESDAVSFGLELGEKSPLSPDSIAPNRVGTDATLGKPLEHRLRRIAGRSAGPGRRRLGSGGPPLVTADGTSPPAIMAVPNRALAVEGQRQAGVFTILPGMRTFGAKELLIAAAVACRTNSL